MSMTPEDSSTMWFFCRLMSLWLTRTSSPAYSFPYCVLRECRLTVRSLLSECTSAQSNSPSWKCARIWSSSSSFFLRCSFEATAFKCREVSFKVPMSTLHFFWAISVTRPTTRSPASAWYLHFTACTVTSLFIYLGVPTNALIITSFFMNVPFPCTIWKLLIVK